MISHHLHRADILLMNIVAGKGVATAEHVVPFDVEFIYIFSIIFYAAIILHLDAGHFFQHLRERFVARIGKTCHAVGYGVASLADARCFDVDCFELRNFLIQSNIIHRLSTNERQCAIGKPQNGEVKHVFAFGQRAERNFERSVGFGSCEFQNFVSTFRAYRDHHICQAFASGSLGNLARQSEWLRSQMERY